MRQLALLIGVDDYPFAPLTSCVNDATAMRDLLLSLGIFQPNDCVLMTSPATPGSVDRPTRDAILDWLLPIYEADPPLDRLLVYFAGHGLSFRRGRDADALCTAIVPAGVATLANAGGKMIDLDELLLRFARRGAREQNWVIDACRNVPDGVFPNVATIGWNTPQPGDPRDALDMAQATLYAVAPLGQALAARNGHGLLTGHLLDGLACNGPAQWGAGGWYDDNSDSWLISLASLCDYAQARIAATLPPDSWQRDYVLPQILHRGREPGPLRDAGNLPNRPFTLFIEPPAAAQGIDVSLSVSRIPAASWPPHAYGATVPLPPVRYLMRASLNPKGAGWQPPKVAKRTVDVAATDTIVLQIDPAAAVAPTPVDPFGHFAIEPTPSAAKALRDPFGDAPAVAPAEITQQAVPPVFVPDPGRPKISPLLRFLVTPDNGHYETQPATLTVRAIDPGASVRLTRLSGGRERRTEKIGTPITLAEGLWRIEVMLGTDVIAVHEENLANGNAYEVTATAQVTPALAALLADPARPTYAPETPPPVSIVPSETIGPMQGAILPTLLPMLALKPFDNDRKILQGLSHRLAIPLVPDPCNAPAAVALAFDGPWDNAWDDTPLMERAAGTQVTTGGLLAQPAWQDPTRRISLFAQPLLRPWEGIVIEVPGWGLLDVAAPRIDGYCTVVAATVWRDGTWDLSISLFRMPPGIDDHVRPGRLSRAIAIAARLFQAGASIEDVNYDVFNSVSQGSWGDPVLGALAWFGNAGRPAGPAPDPNRASQIEIHQQAVRNFLTGVVPGLTDTRVIDALSLSPPGQEIEFDRLLADPLLAPPVLAASVTALARHAIARDRTAHWSVARLQQLRPDAVFNAARLQSAPDSTGTIP